MTKQKEHRGEKFEIDDSEGCYLKVTYGELAGYVGVYLQGTEDQPYGWGLSHYGWRVTKDGLQDANNVSTIEEGLTRLCDALIREDQQRRGKAAFKPEEACSKVHEFYSRL